MGLRFLDDWALPVSDRQMHATTPCRSETTQGGDPLPSSTPSHGPDTGELDQSVTRTRLALLVLVAALVVLGAVAAADLAAGAFLHGTVSSRPL